MGCRSLAIDIQGIMLALIPLLLIFGAPFLARACDPEITDVVKKHLQTDLIGADFTEFLKNKVFVDVYSSRKYICLDCIAATITCSWSAIEANNANALEVVYKFRSIGYFPGVAFFADVARLKKGGGLSTGSKKTIEKHTDGYFIESKDGVAKYQLYPIYVNKEEGVYAFHRCSIKDKYIWWTNIAVSSDKWGDPPVGMYKMSTWDKVVEAHNKIKGLKLKDHDSGKTYQKPYECAMEKKYPILK